MGDEGDHCKTVLDVHHVQVVLPNFNDTPTEMLFVYQPSKTTSTGKASDVAAALQAAVTQVNETKKETVCTAFNWRINRSCTYDKKNRSISHVNN